jgi:hypothetical protein
MNYGMVYMPCQNSKMMIPIDAMPISNFVHGKGRAIWREMSNFKCTF